MKDEKWIALITQLTRQNSAFIVLNGFSYFSKRSENASFVNIMGAARPPPIKYFSATPSGFE
jgi:hypothetical protein